MIIGIPKEIKENEYRVSLTSEAVACLVAAGQRVVVETGAGAPAGCEDDDYRQAGATMVPTIAAVYEQADMIVKVKEILPPEYDLLREGQIIFTYLHSANRSEETQALLDHKVVGIAYEDVMTDDGQFPLLAPMSQIAGEVGLLMGVQYMSTLHGGNGILIGGAAGVEPARVAVLGAGEVGMAAARFAIGLGADVTVVDISLNRLNEVRRNHFSRIKTLHSSPANLENLLPRVDLLINAIKWSPGVTLVSREMLRLMKKNSLIVDIDCEPGGGIETCRFTTHEEPVFVEEGIRHYCVANLPSAYARTASYALCAATLPYALEIAEKGWLTALETNRALRTGLTCAAGHLTFRPTADKQNRPHTPAEQVIRELRT